MMTKRKTVVSQKIAQKFSMKAPRRRWVMCSRCQSTEIEVSEEAVGGICWRCLSILTPPKKLQSQGTPASTNRPRGWRWMSEFVDRDGNVFHKGIEQPELKGTLPPTEVKKKSARQKLEEKEKREEKELMKAAERYKKRKKEERQNGKYKTIEQAVYKKTRGRPKKSGD